MFVDPSNAVTTALAWIREASIICGIVVVGWHARGVYQTANDFVDSVKSHMKTMEGFALRMETNHIKHIEQYLYLLAKGKLVLSEPDLVSAEDVRPPDPPDASDAV